MKIGILGAGNIGGNLGKIWAAKGHEIFFAVRDPQSDKVKALLKDLGSNVRTGSVKEAAAFGEVVLLSIHWQNVPEILQEIQGLMSNKILIDTSNRMIPPPPDTTGSAAEDIARSLQEAKVVKAFNTMGANNLTNLKFGSENASTFICGDDLEAKAIVTQLAQEIGFDVVDVGLLNTATLIESLTKLWVQISRNYGREIAFKLLRR